MFKRYVVKTLALSGLFGLLLLATQAWAGGYTVQAAPGDGGWPVWIQGRPLSLEPGSSPGFYFWHDDDGLHLWTTTPFTEEHTFTAVLTTNGHFRNVSRERFEPEDAATVTDGGHTLLVRLHTYDGIDGVNFRVQGGDHLTLRLYHEGHLLDPAFVYAGRFSVHPANIPFTIDR